MGPGARVRALRNRQDVLTRRSPVGSAAGHDVGNAEKDAMAFVVGLILVVALMLCIEHILSTRRR